MGVDPGYVPQVSLTEKAYESYREYLHRLRIKCPDFETFSKMTGRGFIIAERKEARTVRVKREGPRYAICD
jgi:hypothetical protein